MEDSTTTEDQLRAEIDAFKGGFSYAWVLIDNLLKIDTYPIEAQGNLRGKAQEWLDTYQNSYPVPEVNPND